MTKQKTNTTSQTNFQDHKNIDKKVIVWVKKYVNMMMWPLEDHYYHRYEHALDVTQRAFEIGMKESIDDEYLEVLVIAWLFHDIGFVIQYEDNKYIWASIAKNYLKSILYPQDKIYLIEQLIIATIPQKEPQWILESILKDAVSDSFGRDDFFENGEKLKKELEQIKKIKILDPEWRHYSIDLLVNHKFNTLTNQKERQDKKEENLDILKNKISLNL